MTLRANYTPSVQELRSLVYCGDLGSVSRAADALNLTQGAVSRSIRSLEERLGVQLFRRVRKRLHLSDAGRAMVHEARDILERLDHSARMAMAFGGEGDVLRLAVLPTFAATWLIPRLPEFLKSHPGVSIDLASALHPVNFDESPFDAAIQRAVMARKDTNVTPLLEESLIMVAAPGLFRRVRILARTTSQNTRLFTSRRGRSSGMTGSQTPAPAGPGARRARGCSISIW